MTYHVVRPLDYQKDLSFSVCQSEEVDSTEHESCASFDTNFEAVKLATVLNQNLRKLASKEDYAVALDSQTACNLGALVHQFDRVITKLQYEARLLNHGTDWINQHPIVRLYAEQIMFLSSKRDWLMAHEYCEKRQ